MLIYCSGTELKDLAEELLNQFDAHPLHNPLSPEIFVVQNHGMAQWLSLYIAEERGIAANLKFEFPAERIWALIRMMDPTIPETLPSDRMPMAWSLMNILRNDSDPALNILQEYIREEDPQKREMRRWKLSGRISDVFDQYLTYRPEMLLSWEKNRLVTDFPEERWQSILWRKLNKYWSKSPETDHEHRAKLQRELLNGIDQQKISSGELPQRISVFGVSTMPPVYLKILVKLSALTDVYFYTLEPAGEIEHPIYESMGGTGNEYLSLLKLYIDETGVESKHIDLRRSKYNNDSLLHSFKQAVQGFSFDRDVDTENPSISIHSCHSPRREVEVLYDQLLALFERNESLNPSDVLVVTPNLAAFAPEIKAVFDTVEETLPAIPFHLVERQVGHADPVAKTVVKLMDL
ncbi:MAG: exodeoxyribonuclease V subunit gamma, partial [Balneolaceae bacterium]|nr:exodeoxyribonuclease V subunit gamma [Balneolaceae bacterium]